MWAEWSLSLVFRWLPSQRLWEASAPQDSPGLPWSSWLRYRDSGSDPPPGCRTWLRGSSWSFSPRGPDLPSGRRVLPSSKCHCGREVTSLLLLGRSDRFWGDGCQRRWAPGLGVLPCRLIWNSHTALLLPSSPSPVCFRTWRRESAGRCFCEWPPSPRCRSPKDRGARPPRSPAVWHLPAAPRQPRLCQQNTWQVKGDGKSFCVRQEKSVGAAPRTRGCEQMETGDQSREGSDFLRSRGFICLMWKERGNIRRSC